MIEPRTHWFEHALPLVFVALVGCSTPLGDAIRSMTDSPPAAGKPTVVTVTPSPPAGGSSPAETPKPPAQPVEAKLAPQTVDARLPAPALETKPSVASIRPDVLCNVPEEQFAYEEVIKQRFGTEGVLRLRKLLSTNFGSADLTPQDRKILRTLSRETLWIPAPLEEQLGNLLLKLEESKLTTVPNNDATTEYWSESERLLSRLLGSAPPTPFKTRLMILKTGVPNALAGGMIFIDQETVRKAVDDPQNMGEQAKLTFIYAHELAHVYKRHKAKHIQQLLVDTDDGLKLTRELLSGVHGSNASPMDWISSAFGKLTMAKQMVELLRNQHAQFAQDQEQEADGCATALMLKASLGDPVLGFRTYLKDKPPAAKPGQAEVLDPYPRHPPDPKREKAIEAKARQLAQGTSAQRESRDKVGRKRPTAPGGSTRRDQ